MKHLSGLIFILCLSYNLAYAQKEDNLFPLNQVIADIETNYNVKFSYSNRDLKSIFVAKPNVSLDIKEVLNYLNENAPLNFKLLNDRYITISKLNKKIKICGTIRANDTNQALLGASILIEGTTKGTTSSIDGTFTLENVPLNAIINISFVGFKTIELEAQSLFASESTTCKTLSIEVFQEELNEIVITKFLTTGLQKNIDGSTILNTDKFGILPGLVEPDILQSIQALPGVESSNESIANINVRGGTNDQNLMLWDNIKMYHSGHFFGLISAYNPNLTNKVVVTKNGTSSALSDGVSSTINMFTKDALSETVSGGIGINSISADAFLQIPLSNKIGLQISGRRSFTDIYTSPTYDEYFERSFQDSDINTNALNTEGDASSNFLFYDYTGKLLIDVSDNHKLRANVIGISNSLDYSERIMNNQNETQTRTSQLTQDNLGAGFTWKAKWNTKISSEINTYYSKYNVDATDKREEADQRLTQANEVLETGLKLKTYIMLSKKLSWLNGYQFNETGILNETTVSAPSYQRTKKDVLLNHAAFSEIIYNSGKTYLRTGLRVNYFQKFNKILVEPRLNFRQKLDHQFAVKIAGEFKNQSATQIIDFQDDFLGVENRRWILADEVNIPISTSKQVSLGFEYEHNNFLVDITGFYKMIDGITASNQGFYNNFQFLNASGSYTTSGIEFLANKTSDAYSAWISYTYAKNDYNFDVFIPSQFPNNVDIRHSVSLAFNYNVFNNLKISCGGIWRSGLPFTQPVEGNETVTTNNTTSINYDAPNAENLDDFFRIDASLSYNFNFSKKLYAFLRVGVLNITNQRNVINRYYEVDPNNSDSTIQIDNFSIGITPNVSFKINF